MSSETSEDEQIPDSSAPIIGKLAQALGSDGDFPARTQAVLKVKTLVNNPNTPVEQIAEVILTEVSLGTRVLHLVNSAYYSSGREITTISEAIMRVGMHSLSDMFSGMVMMQKFIPVAKRGGSFADNIKKSVLTSLLAADFAEELQQPKMQEQAYLSGTFYNLGYLLLAYYFPQVYESAASRANMRGHSVNQSIAELLGIRSVDLCLSVIKTLKIPDMYVDVLVEAHKSFSGREASNEANGLADVVATAAALADIVIYSSDYSQLVDSLAELAELSHRPLQELEAVVHRLPDRFGKHCEVIDMNFLRLPEHLYSSNDDEDATSEVGREDDPLRQFHGSVREIKRAATDGEPISSILLIALEAVVEGLHFDRALLLLFNPKKTELQGKMSLGSKLPVDPRSVVIHVNAPDNDNLLPVRAVKDGTPQTLGDYIFRDSKEQVAIPIGFGKNIIGVIYAEILSNTEEKMLNFETGGALQTLTQSLQLALSTRQ